MRSIPWRLAAVCFALAACCSLALGQNSAAYSALVEKGKTQLLAGRNAEALTLAKQAIKLDPNRWKGYALAGLALKNLKRYEESADDFNQALKRAPKAKQATLSGLRRQCLLAAAGVAIPTTTAPAPKPAASAPVTQAEIVLWESIKNSTNPADFQTYLQQYPHGAFVALARRHLSGAEKQAEKIQKQRQALTELRDRIGRVRLAYVLQGQKSVNSFAFSPNGKMLASGGDDKTVKLWNVASGKLVRTLEGHEKSVTSIAFSPDGRTLASGSDDKTIKLWDVASGKLLHTLEGHQKPVNSVAFSPNGKILASGSDDKTIKLWDTATGELLSTFATYGSEEYFTFSPDGRTLLSASYPSDWHSTFIATVWDVANGQMLLKYKIPDGPPVVSPDGRILEADDSSHVWLYDAGTGQLLRALKLLNTTESTSSNPNLAQAIAFSPDSRTMAFACSDGTVRLYDVATGELLSTLDGHQKRVDSVAFSPDGSILASGGHDKTIDIWNVRTRQLLRTLEGSRKPVTSIIFSPNGFIMASRDSSDDDLNIFSKAIDLWGEFPINLTPPTDRQGGLRARPRRQPPGNR